MHPAAPDFSARGHRGGWVHRRRLYFEAYDVLSGWAWRTFRISIERVEWQDADEDFRSALLAWRDDFSEESYRHLRNAYPDVYNAVVAQGRHQPIPQRNNWAQAAATSAVGQADGAATAVPQPPQPGTPTSPSSSTATVSTQAAAPSAAVAPPASHPRLSLRRTHHLARRQGEAHHIRRKQGLSIFGNVPPPIVDRHCQGEGHRQSHRRIRGDRGHDLRIGLQLQAQRGREQGVIDHRLHGQ